jgi:hypothetical protein
MRTFPLFAATLVVMGASSWARADDVAACGDAFDRSQVKRDEGKLLEARRLLRVCGGANCSPTEQRLCSEWLTDVEARIPSFVLSAKDGSGADLVDVKVLMDGVQVATKLDGRSLDVDPGPHSFVFELADGTKAQANAVAGERGKGKVVFVTYALRPPSVTFGPPQARAAGEVVPARAGAGSSWKTTGLVAGAAGVVGVALGAVFGAEALSTKGSHCDSSGLCDPGSASTAYNQATISTVGFVAGGILLAGGVTMYLLAPKNVKEPPAANVALAPMVGPSRGGLQLAGRW